VTAPQNTPAADPPQPSPIDGLRAVWRFSAGERAPFLGAVAALFGSAAALYAVPLVPQSVFDAVFGDAAAASALSLEIVAWLGGRDALREGMWRAAAAMVALAAVAGVGVHLKATACTTMCSGFPQPRSTRFPRATSSSAARATSSRCATGSRTRRPRSAARC
jgi:hypothetical protein